MTLIQAACHCTGVRFKVKPPEWVLDCNCTICRRYGTLWTYPEPDAVTFVAGAGTTQTYIWGDRELEFHRCAECGCVTHMAPVEDAARIFGLNARLIPTLDPKAVRIIQKDNAHSGFFWTRSDGPPQPSRHPKMPPPSPDDWR